MTTFQRESQIGTICFGVTRIDTVEWNTAMFEELLKQVVVHHSTATSAGDGIKKSLDNAVKKTLDLVNPMPMSPTSTKSDVSTNLREEVAETLNLPEFVSKKVAPTSRDCLELSDSVKLQLHSFIFAITNAVRPKDASHVAMATKKHLQRVVTRICTTSQTESCRILLRSLLLQQRL
jgi:hypothetical protein